MIELIAVVRVLACIVALTLAGYLCFNDKDGWGWFLFIAVCLGSFEVKVDK